MSQVKKQTQIDDTGTSASMLAATSILACQCETSAIVMLPVTQCSIAASVHSQSGAALHLLSCGA